MRGPRGRRVVVLGHGDAEAIAQFGVELRLHGTDGDVTTVGRGVDAVEVRAAVEQIGFPFVAPGAGRQHPEVGRQQRRHAVDHRDVEHLTHPGLARLEDRAEQADRQKHSAAAVVADQIQRRHR